MATGGHFVTGFRDNTESNLCGLHYETGVGWGLFPKRPISSDNAEPDMHLDPHNGSLTRLWLGCRNTWATNYKYRIHEWDGENWTAHDFFGGGASYGGHTLVSRSPGDERVVFVCCGAENGAKNMLAKFDNGAWSVLRAAGSYGTIFYIPLAISSTTCVWAAHTTYNDGGGEKAGYWLDPTTQYSGGDLPVRGFGGIARLANGQVFLLDVAGHVWRADSHLGPFVEDNPTCGPHIDGFAYLAGVSWPVAMSPSADGSTIVIQEQTGQKYWARNGYDDYTLCYTGQSNAGQPAAIDRQTLFAARANGPPRASNDGGSTWYTVSNGFASVGDTLRARAACALIDEVSTEERLIAVTQEAQSGEAYRIHWRGDSPYSPWAPWGEFYHAEPGSANPQYMRSVVGFASKHLVISGTRANAAYSNITHYDPATDSWTEFKLISDTCTALSCGSKYKPGKLHALLYSWYSTPLIYGRWNGASYDVASIPGSSRHSNDNYATYSLGYNIACDATGQHIWITVYQSGQVWHSADGGSSWTNRHSAAAGVHADAGQARDVYVVSATEVYVALDSTGAGTRFSAWNGSQWSVAAPDSAKEAGSYRCIYVDQAGALWFLESNPSSGPRDTYKLVEGAWVLQNTYSSHGGARDVTGITEMGDGSVFAIAMDTEVASDGWDGHIQQLADDDPLGWFTNRGISARTPYFGITAWGPVQVIDSGVWNPSYEIPGEDVGSAAYWLPGSDAGAEDLATYEGSILPYEPFEAGWQGGNQLTLEAFADSDLQAATYGESTAEKETFSYGWRRPVYHMALTFSNTGRTAPAHANPNDTVDADQLYRDLDTGGRAVVKEKTGTDAALFTYVDLVNPIELALHGFARGSFTSVRLAVLNRSYFEIGVGNGAQRSFGLTTVTNLHAKQAGRSATLQLQATIGGVQKVFVDDGAGNIIADPDDPNTIAADLNPNFAQTITYDTGRVSVVFANGPDTGTKVELYADHGALVTDEIDNDDSPLPFVDVVTPQEPCEGYHVPPYNHSQLEVFLPDQLAAAEFDGAEEPEAFEQTWSLPAGLGGDNADSSNVFAASDLTSGTFDSAATTNEDFEDLWEVNFGGNEISQATYAPADLSAGTFDTGANTFEDYEGTWPTQVQV